MTESRNKGITVETIPSAAHFCHFYATKQELLDTLVPYFKTGLEARELCVWVVAESIREQEAWTALREAVPDLDRHRSDGSIELFQGRKWYLKDGTFDPVRVSTAKNQKLDQAVAHGYAGLRFSGDASWVQRKDWENFCEYEKTLNQSITDQPTTLLCTYPLAARSAAEMLDVAHTHQFVLAGRNEHWEVFETVEGRIDPSPDGGFGIYQRNIAERKRAEEALRRSEAYLAEGQRISHTGSLAVNLSSGEVFWSQEMFRIYGLDPTTAKLSQQMAFQLIHPEDRAFVQEQFQRAVREKIDYAVEHRAILADGSIKYLHALGHPVSNDSGDLTEYIGTVVDITERKRTEAKLREANERVEMILDSITDNFFALDSEWRFTYLNKHAEKQIRTLGRNPAGLIGKITWEEFPADPAVEQVFRRAKSERKVTTHEHYYPPLGEWVENRIYPTPDGGVAIFQRYVTERRRAEEELRDANVELHSINEELRQATDEIEFKKDEIQSVNEQLENLMASTDIGTIFLDRKLCIKRYTPQIQNLFNILPSDINRPLEDITHLLDYVSIREDAQHVLAQVKQVEREARSADGRQYIVRLRPFRTEENWIDGVVVTFVEITERKHAEDALQKAHAELAHATRVTTLGEMTASIAHELNQPLAAIVTNGEASLRLLSREAPDLQGAREALESMISDGLLASEVIKRIRGLLKKAVPEKSLLDINSTLQEVIALVTGEVAKNQVVLRTDLATNLPQVFGDRVQLQQVVLNLILNGNEAMMGSEWRPRQLLISSQLSEPQQVNVAVRDSGIGLDLLESDRVFDPFFTTKSAGLGLGLSISRTIIEEHGGRLWATPNKGQGTTFQFSLPTSR